MAVQPLNVESVVDQVYAAVRARILDGDLARGTKLRQEALAEELGVSRTPLREALRRLAAEGLVEFHPNRGAQVAHLRPEAVRAAYEARLVFEPGAARLAAQRQPREELDAMRLAVQAERAGGEPRNAYAASRAFHLALARASGNEYLARLAESLWHPGLADAIFDQQIRRPGSLDGDVEEHEAIVAAIADGDGTRAEALTRRHIHSALERLLEGWAELRLAVGPARHSSR
jgi:DNA-binding GntR family transcriptional regulator